MIRGLPKLIGKIMIKSIEVVCTLMLLGLCIFVDARYIEPKLLIVKEQAIPTAKLSLEEPLRIVQFSDTHLGLDYSTEDLKRVVNKINGLKPDMIIFTGDLIDDNKQFNEVEATIQALGGLRAKYGMYAVYGNHDHGGNGTERYAQIMEASGFQLLVNSHEVIVLPNGQKVNIMGVDDIVLSKPDFNKVTKEADTADYQLLISHAPDVVEYVDTQLIDLQLSGHSHGGQVRLPILGAPFTVPYGRDYIKGLYQVEGSEKMLLYVNSGIGMSQLPYRFCNPPEITLLLIQ